MSPAVLAQWNDLFAGGVKLDVLWNAAVYSGPVERWKVTPALFAASVKLRNLDSFEGTNESNYSCSGQSSWLHATKAQQIGLWDSMQHNGLGMLPLLAPSYGACHSLSTTIDEAEAMGSLAGYSSFGNLHSYPGNQNYPEIGCLTAASARSCRGSNWRDVSNIENPSQPVVVTETGYESQSGGCQWNAGAAGQERYLLRTLLNDWNEGISRTYLFEFLDDYASDGCYLGIMKDTGIAKPSFTAITNLISTLSDRGVPFVPGTLNCLLGGNTVNIDHTLLEKRDGSYAEILWQAVPSIDKAGNTRSVSPQSVTLTFHKRPKSIQAVTFTDAGSLSAVDVATVNRVSTVSVTDVPVIVMIQP